MPLGIVRPLVEILSEHVPDAIVRSSRGALPSDAVFPCVFYNQSPDSMRSLGSAFALVTVSLGIYLSSFILTLVSYFTTRGDNLGWISDNLNEGHLDRFFWLIASLSFLNLLLFIYYAQQYKCKRASAI